jgi:hypothetical protein
MLGFTVSPRALVRARLLDVLSTLQANSRTVPSVERSTQDPHHNLLEQPPSVLPEGTGGPVTTAFSRSIFPTASRSDQVEGILFEASPVARIDSVAWALLRGRLARHAPGSAAPRMAEAAILLSGEQFHALLLQWELSQRLFFGGAVTRWTVHHACRLAAPLGLDMSLLVEDADPNVRAAHLVSAALHFAMSLLTDPWVTHRRNVTSYLPLDPESQPDRDVYFSNVLCAYVRSGDQGRVGELLPLRQWLYSLGRQMQTASNEPDGLKGGLAST